MALGDQDKKLLNDIFSASLKSPNGINSARFRADNEQFIPELDQLQLLGYLQRRNDLYSITLLALAYLAKENPDAQSIVQKCGLVFALLQGSYRDNLWKDIPVPDIARNTGLSADDLRAALRFIIQTPILGSYSSDVTSKDAFVAPSEGILKYKSFEDILKEREELDKNGQSQYRESKKLASQSKDVLTFLNEKMQELAVLDTLPPENIEFPTWCKEIEIYLHKSFGKDSIEYETFKEAGIIRGIVGDAYTEYRKAIGSRETALVSIINAHEALGDEEPLGLKDSIELPIQLFDAMQFHPKVIIASKSLFRDGHYASAILEAYKAVNNFVKEKSNLTLDGTALMAKVFKKNAAIIKLNELLDESDQGEQEGFMFLFMGAMLGIRNPKAHDNVVQADPYRTLEYLGFASLLMRTIEEGKIVSSQQ